jgi:hypothetical protein
MSEENATIGLDRFLLNRERPLNQRFPGTYRAIVVETNDPLDMHRIRFKCPEMHDYDLKPEECPWAVSQFSLGGKRAGSWVSPCIGDWVWITFEKQHPYGPIWTGFCTPTRRKFYSYPAIYGVTPLPVDSNGTITAAPSDYNKDYLPKDSRPMSSGLIDRYGSLDMISSVGFFPVEHKEKPPGADNDPLQSQTSTSNDGAKTPYKQTTLPPEMNNPDGKFMVRLSKYGHLLLMGDQGYHWQVKDTSGSSSSKSDVGEFYGDSEKDEEWEIKRWKYMQRLINEDAVKDADQRRMMSLTRYGHKFEMRDVGWNKTRIGEFDDAQHKISDSSDDERWIKLRTKGGMLFQMSDIGFDSTEDAFVKRKLLDETGTKTEKEDQYWKGDARWVRWITRNGFKLVLDDRGSSTTNADTNENPRGYGILLKGRRTPGAQGTTVSGNPRGFFWEFNEKDQVNQTTWGSPLGTTAQINDKIQYFMVANKLAYPMPWKGITANEFLEDPLVSDNVEKYSHHIKLDFHNQYIRLKSAGGQSTPWGNIVNPVARQGIQQGLECRDGSLGDDPWTELVDIDDRGLWFSGKKGLTVCRAKQYPYPIKICWWFDEAKKEIVISNLETGKIQISCSGDVEVVAQQDAKVYANRNISMRSNNKITLMGGSGMLEIDSNYIKINKVLRWMGYDSYIPIEPPDVLTAESVPQLEPTNRGARYNTDLEYNKDIA